MHSSNQKRLAGPSAYFPLENSCCHHTHFKWSNATIGNQAFSHDGCNIFPRLSYNKANNTFLNSLGKNKFEAQVEFTLQNYGKGEGHLLLM